jgi:hypothetical protein
MVKERVALRSCCFFYVHLGSHFLVLQVSAEEWEGIPDVGDRTIKKRPRFMAVAAAPDSLLSKAAAASQMDASISVDGLQTPAGAATNADLTAIGEQQQMKRNMCSWCRHAWYSTGSSAGAGGQ